MHGCRDRDCIRESADCGEIQLMQGRVLGWAVLGSLIALAQAASTPSSSAHDSSSGYDRTCDREAAVYGFGQECEDHDDGHHNYQLALYGLSVIFLSGAIVEHFVEIMAVPLPYSMLLLVFGLLFGVCA